ncbi:MAG: hypothetical protein ACLQF1_09385, partial [Methyloceanibacter sp.]
ALTCWELSSQGLATLILLSRMPLLTRSWTDALRGARPLAENGDSRGSSPGTWNTKSAPHLRSSTFHEIDAIRIAREGKLERVVGVIAFAVTVDEPLECPHHLKALPAPQKGVRQVEEHVAVDNLRRAT